MKNISFISAFLFFFFTSVLVPAQTKLPDSRRGSENAYLYTVSKENLREIYLNGKTPTEDMLERQVASYPRGADIPDLPRGNYMIVTSNENRLNLVDHTVDDLYFKIIPSGRMMLCLYDSSGNLIEDAVVKLGSKTLRYDKTSKTYNAKSVKDEQVLEINNNGVCHYIEFEDQDHYYRSHKSNVFKTSRRKMQRLWFNVKNKAHCILHPDDRPVKNKYTGFVVFSKPRYKPGETVKLKAYMTEYNGKPYKKPVDLRLYSYHPERLDTILTKLSPYRPGMYEYRFTLSDSLNLKLDNYYTVRLSHENENENEISDRFKYEEYELKSIRFSASAGKKEYAKNDTVRIKLKATDENEMAVYDGKVEVLVFPRNFTYRQGVGCDAVFIPDTLWAHTVDLSGVSEKELILPDSIFPENVSLHYRVRCTYLSADNEKKEQTMELYRNANDYVIDYALEKGILTIKELYRGQSQEVTASITVSGENEEILWKDSVRLPYSLPIPWMASDVSVKTLHTGTNEYFCFDERELREKTQIGYRFYRNNDSIFLAVDNPAKIPFWYTIRKKNKEIASGYATQLDYSVKDKGEDGYAMQLSYLFAGSEKCIEESLPFVQKNMTIDVSTPTSVYPGQQTNVLVSVTDKKGKPVDGVDVTAYAFTSKFEDYSLPGIPVGGKAAYAKQFNNSRYKPEESVLINREVDMTWQTWKNTMALDTIAYYHFLYPDYYYAYREPTPDGSTRISPFVVIDGEPQGIHMLWIDDRLYYVNQAQQLDVYTFRVAPGKHKLRFRTHDREILVSPVWVEKGMKNILSFNAGDSYSIRINEGGRDQPFALSSRLLDKEEQGTLSKQEVSLLASQLITVDNNFGSVRLPNLSQQIDLPAYINSGNNLYYLNYTPRSRYDHTLQGKVNTAVLAGPFPSRNFMNGLSDVAAVYADGKLLANIGLEGGNNYTLYKDYQKIKSWNRLPFNRNIPHFKPKTNFREQPLTESKIEEYHRNRIANILSESKGTPDNKKNAKDGKIHTCRLNLSLGKDAKGSEIKPSFIFIIPEKKEDIAHYRLYYGGTRNFQNLPAGIMNVSLVFKDSTTYSRTIDLKPNGENYLRIDSIECRDNSSLAETAYWIFNRNIKKVQTENPYITTVQKDSAILVTAQTTASFNEKNARQGIVSGTVRDLSGDPVVGAFITIEGTYSAVVADINGHFELSGKNGDKFNISSLGYVTQTEKYSEGYHYDIVLEEKTLPFEEVHALEEVVITGYGIRKKANLTGAISSVLSHPLGFLDRRVLKGKVAGVAIRGENSIEQSEPPLILVNGVPFNGRLEDLDAGSFTSFSVLKDAAATALYGSRAANGVIMIQTNALHSAPQQQDERTEPAAEAGNAMRKNFHDDAFWQPRLKTDKNGEASFEVTYPDDITAWNACFIAVGGKKQRDKKQMTIHSFKSLTARLSTPRFSVRGDSMRVVGRIANHFGDSISLERTIETPGHTLREEMNIAASHVDYIPVKAGTGDSLSIAYSLQTPGGYFDGEERSVPIIGQGMLQTTGDFKVINDTATHTLHIHPELGAVTIHAEASSLELFLREIDKVDRYPYLCNEQMASKIKALLSKKRIAAIFGKEFKEDKKIDNLISRLNKNRNPEGLWGWWNNSRTEFWISGQVLGALLDAADAGYKTRLDSAALHMAVEQELRNGLTALKNTSPDKVPFAKQELLDRLVLLKRMNAPVDYPSYFRQIDEQLASRTTTDKLKTALAQSCIGLEAEIEIDSLMHDSNKTMLGSLYWSDKKEGGLFPRNFMLPYENNTEYTLIAYKILRNIGGHEAELEKIRNYFFERRQGGAWANTYESSRIIETILPDMLKPGEKYSGAVLSVNGRPVTTFPYTDKIETRQPIRIKREGTAPLFVTAYQQEWNKNPEAESAKGFAVRSYFTANNDTVALLTAGKTVLLETTVRVDADAEYVQIEAPIPAGCTYETKGRGDFRKEVHREYYKEKVVIFCNKLQKGEHTFTIELIPRYTGLYSLNPAKAELMYFPTFYGNERLKQVVIESE